jgi:hypothetical protein
MQGMIDKEMGWKIRALRSLRTLRNRTEQNKK